MSKQAATRRFTYGYGRAEDIAGVFIVLMIALSAVVAGYESILRILRLKAKHGLLNDPYVPDADVDRVVGVPAHLRAADRIAERTTTLLVNEEGLLPLSRRRTPRVLVVGADPASPSLSDGPPTTVMAAALNGLGFTATALSTGTAPSAATITKAVTAAADADAVVALT